MGGISGRFCTRVCGYDCNDIDIQSLTFIRFRFLYSFLRFRNDNGCLLNVESPVKHVFLHMVSAILGLQVSGPDTRLARSLRSIRHLSWIRCKEDANDTETSPAAMPRHRANEPSAVNTSILVFSSS